MSVGNGVKLARAKLREGLQLAARFDIVLIQEVRGCAADVHRLQAELPHHVLRATHIHGACAGGAIIIVNPRLLSFATVCEHEVIRAGRIHLLDLHLGAVALRIINVHVQEEPGESNKNGVLEALGQVLSRQFAGIIMLAGDFNATVTGEGRFNVQTKTVSNNTEWLSKRLDRMLAKFTEMSQDDYTHRVRRDGILLSLSRLDRIYSSLPPQSLLDHAAQGGTTRNAEGENNPSDHVPTWISLTTTAEMRDRNDKIPRWIADHPSFPGMVEETLHAMGGLGECPYENIRDAKAAMRQAAIKIKGAVNAEDWRHSGCRVHVLLKLWRLLQDGQLTKVDALCCRFPMLRKYFDGLRFGVPDIQGLDDAISEAIIQNAQREIDELDRDVTIKESRKNARRNTLLHQSKAWKSGQRKVFLQGIKDENGDAIPDVGDAADHLRAHWQEVSLLCLLILWLLLSFVPLFRKFRIWATSPSR